MAITNPQNAGNGSSVGTVTITASFTNPISSGDCIAGFVTWDNGSTPPITSILDNVGNSYTIIDNILQPSDNQNFASFLLGNIPGTPTNVTVSWSPLAPTSVVMRILHLQGAFASSQPIDGHAARTQTTPGTGADAVTSSAFTTTVSGDAIIGGIYTGATTNIGTGFTDSGESTSSNGTFVHAEWKTQAASGSTQATFTQTVNNNTAAAAMGILAAASTTSPSTAFVFSAPSTYFTRRVSVVSY